MRQDGKGMAAKTAAYSPPRAVEMEEFVVGEKRGIATQRGLESIGARIARFRKERGLTQQQLADELGVAQPIVSKYESGELRLHGELIVQLSRLLDVTADELLGIKEPAPAAVPKDKRLLRRLKDFDRLSKRDREALVRTVEAFLSRAKPA